MKLRPTAEVVHTTTKLKSDLEKKRKALIVLPTIVPMVNQWQERRPPLLETDMNLPVLKDLLVGEIYEIDEHRQREGLPGYDHDAEVGETIDALFFAASVTRKLQTLGGSVDYEQVRNSANGQSKDSASLERMIEVAGNFSESSLQKDSQYFWELLVSYIIHMKFPVNPTQTLLEYTLPKNNGNYSEFMLKGNPIFEMAYGKGMDEEELVEYFSHYRRATRIIRDFLIKYVDPMVEHHGLADEHLLPYRLFIFSFISIRGINISPEVALVKLKEQLHKDYNIPQPLGIRDNPIFRMAYGRNMNQRELVACSSHYSRATNIIRNFLTKHVDPKFEHRELSDKDLFPYRLFIFSFMNIKGTGIGPGQALVMLRDQLYKDYDIAKPLDRIEVASV